MLRTAGSSYTIIRMSTVDLVQESVLSELLRGALPPGTWIRQDELADKLGVSKIPVREALQRLAAIGLVRFEANRGVIVPMLSAAEADENYAIRRAIEPILLARAMPKLSIVDFAEAEMALSRSGLSLTEANWVFHRALYRASGWRRGMAMIEILHAAVAPYVVLYTQGLGRTESADQEHAAILAACRSADADTATELLIQHLDEGAKALSKYLRTQAAGNGNNTLKQSHTRSNDLTG